MAFNSYAEGGEVSSDGFLSFVVLPGPATSWRKYLQNDFSFDVDALVLDKDDMASPKIRGESRAICPVPEAVGSLNLLENSVAKSTVA
mmetsp:Transcript_23764/g.57309  ORF Transcript_23764/g.57309 Transcript_23764/m.57309 type:complete len:88 (-) Transcript_23764:975-1238(-)